MPVLLVSTGRHLHKYAVEESGETLLSSLSLPEVVQYAALDNRTGLLHVACSDGGPYAPGSRHHLLSVDVRSAQLTTVGPTYALAARPIHVVVDVRHDRVFVAYNRSPGLTVHLLTADGTIGEMIASGISAGAHYPHQILLLPFGSGVTVVCRGANPTAETPELPGSLRAFEIEGRKLVETHVAAPNGGFGFGPRNAIYDPVSSTAYLSLERQNRFMGLSLNGAGLSSSPAFSMSSLAAAPAFKPQLAGAIRLHPHNRVIYQLNRTHPMAGGDPLTYAGEGENSAVAYRLNDDGSEPAVIQRISTEGIHPRTLSLDDSGRLMAIGNIRTQMVQTGGRKEHVLPCISLFSVDDAGHMTFIRRMLVPTDGLMVWSSFVSDVDLPGRRHAD